LLPSVSESEQSVGSPLDFTRSLFNLKEGLFQIVLLEDGQALWFRHVFHDEIQKSDCDEQTEYS
jgi:hypothetical protein